MKAAIIGTGLVALFMIVFYGIGFVLLLIPTVITFVQLALSVFR